MITTITQIGKANILLAFIIMFVPTLGLHSSNNRPESRSVEKNKAYLEKMRPSGNEIHDQGRKYIGLAVPSLKTDHYTTRLDSILVKTDLQRKEVYYYDENFRIAMKHQFVFA